MLPATQRGMLLLEALTAMAVFSIGVLANIALLAHALRQVNDARTAARPPTSPTP